MKSNKKFETKSFIVKALSMVRALQSPCGSTEPSALCLAHASVTQSGSGFKVKASVVVMLHLCPVGDPILFLWFLQLKTQIELIALSLANFHPLVLWHHPVVDRSLKESKLEEWEEGEKEVTSKRMHLSGTRAGINDGLKRRFRIQRLRKIRLG